MFHKRKKSLFTYCFFILSVFLLVGILGQSTAKPVQAITTTFAGEELLARPTDTTITVNIVPNDTIEYYYEYGTTQGGPYTGQTTPETATGGEPHEVVITRIASIENVTEGGVVASKNMLLSQLQ